MLEHYHLVIVGTGISIVGQMTTESLAWVRQAERFFYAVNEPVAEHVIRAMSKEAKITTSLSTLYTPNIPRREIYRAMTETILESVRAGYITVAAFYGHPGVFAYPGHKAIAQARAEGYKAKMLPGISAEDCLFADIGIDPCNLGCQSLEATDFLLTTRAIDTSGYLILWQIGMVGFNTFEPTGYDNRAMPLLVEKLSRLYPLEHNVIIYEAATILGAEPLIQTVEIAHLPLLLLSDASTLCIPPSNDRQIDALFYSRYEELFPNRPEVHAKDVFR